MLPEIGTKLDGGIPRKLTFVRDLEAFEGPILSEYKATNGGGLYVEKWCAREIGINRFLLVRSEQRAIAEFLSGRLTMLALLRERSDGIGFLVDRMGDSTIAAYITPLSIIPQAYLPKPNRKHDEDLRPDWDIVPQSYLLDEDWDAKMLAVIERHYLNAAGFAFHTQPNTTRQLPAGVLRIEYEGGYSVMHAFNAIRETVPHEAKSKSTGISVNSPGVLTIESPAETAGRLMNALRSLSRSVVYYQAVHAWSRLSPDNSSDVPTVAREQVVRLCSALDVDPAKLYPSVYSSDAEKDVVLVAGKLIAAYYRVLLRVMKPVKGVEFTGVSIDELPAISTVDTQEDEEEVVVLRGGRR